VATYDDARADVAALTRGDECRFLLWGIAAMANDIDQNSREWLSSPRTNALAWWIPKAAIVAALFILYAWEEAPMRIVLAIAALVSIAFGLIAVGRAWYEFRPLTDKERARLRQEGN
jgi:hypothetical protein